MTFSWCSHIYKHPIPRKRPHSEGLEGQIFLGGAIIQFRTYVYVWPIYDIWPYVSVWSKMKACVSYKSAISSSCECLLGASWSNQLYRSEKSEQLTGHHTVMEASWSHLLFVVSSDMPHPSQYRGGDIRLPSRAFLLQTPQGHNRMSTIHANKQI